MISIRAEDARDRAVVRALNLTSFEDDPEADLVDALRASCPAHTALVAVDEALVVGHMLFTPVVVEGGGGSTEGMGLAPMAVLLERQREGIGSMLVS